MGGEGSGVSGYKKLQFKAQRINVIFYTLALLGENVYRLAKTIVDANNNGLMSQLSLLMQVSESNETDRNLKKRLVKGATVLAASLSAARESDSKLQLTPKPNDIQQKINNQTGLVMSFCLNTVSLKELGNVKSMT